jgi:glutamate synthase (ferredoxin)
MCKKLLRPYKGYNIILSDRGVSDKMAPIPMLLACSMSSFDEILKVRSKFGIIRSAEPREPHHFALLFGYGASAINPYLVDEIIRDQVDKSFITGMMTLIMLLLITTKLLQKG